MRAGGTNRRSAVAMLLAATVGVSALGCAGAGLHTPSRAHSRRDADRGAGTIEQQPDEVVRVGEQGTRVRLQYRLAATPWHFRVVTKHWVDAKMTLERRSIVRVEPVARRGDELEYTVTSVRTVGKAEGEPFHDIEEQTRQLRIMGPDGSWKGVRDLSPSADARKPKAPGLPWVVVLPRFAVGRGAVWETALEAASVDLRRQSWRRARYDFLDVTPTSARIHVSEQDPAVSSEAYVSSGGSRTTDTTVELDVERWFRSATLVSTVELEVENAGGKAMPRGTKLRATVQMDVTLVDAPDVAQLSN